MTRLTARGLGVRFDGVDVVTGVDLTVESPDWLMIVGPNGAGKSSLVRALAGLLPVSGRAAVDDVELAGLRPRPRARLIGYVPQAPVLPEAMPVADYVMLGRTAHLGYFSGPRPVDREVVGSVLDTLELTDFTARELGSLSGGERQRVTLARALAQEPTVLLLDEPTSALDLGHQQQVLELVDGLRHRHDLVVVMTVHDLTAAGQYADRVLLLDRGAVVADGPAAQVLTAERIASVYHADVRVEVDDSGRPVVIPARPGT
ncbi:ABC transporter ATP-binding protein [Calidifontibacter sp. DB0510]|uniref:ABC transporter ATP-binding protein n=1 Tax=Metallococcus carri TaxID=1656884 RepID=A0A967AWH9_9MICO|nr:ABC transporter ATP-binding protein [Metallococcus carri]NHN54231.1 ABC transporter ATP-binding protein [Metallococcus carri]NOP36929.1 ABC transporter ATP-binding protein [Calidifontibacter sp. DB2511S]